MLRRITVVTAGHLSTCPRMVKAADALARAGHDVRVVSTRFLGWATDCDQSILSRQLTWPSKIVDYSRAHAPVTAVRTAIRQRVARATAITAGIDRAPQWTVTRAFSRVHSELVAAAAGAPADLIYGGTSGALAAAAEAAYRLNIPYAVDLEDLHSAESVAPGASLQHALVARIESRTIPDASFVTTSSAPIAEFYQDQYRIRPAVIHNVFTLPAVAPDMTRHNGPLRLYWFGQTIGPGRALEDVIDALVLAGLSASIDLRGRPIASYVDSLRARAAAGPARIAIDVLPPIDPDAIVESCRSYDIGISTEDPAIENRRRCLSNKFCAYLLGGLAVVATDTPGQRTVEREVGCGAAWYTRGDLTTLASALERWHRDGASLLASRRASWQAAQDRWHWEHPCERDALLQLVGVALA
jgi:hypothetical protein